MCKLIFTVMAVVVLSSFWAIPPVRADEAPVARNKTFRHACTGSRCGPYAPCGARCRVRCPDGYSCHPLYGAYGPYGGVGYWGAYTYSGWGPRW
jgi:hypothetical protein